MSTLSNVMAYANALAETAFDHAREQRSCDVRAGRAYGNAAQIVEGSPKTLEALVRNSIECFMRGQDWFAVLATVARWADDARLGAMGAYFERVRGECESRIAEAT